MTLAINSLKTTNYTAGIGSRNIPFNCNAKKVLIEDVSNSGMTALAEQKKVQVKRNRNVDFANIKDEILKVRDKKELTDFAWSMLSEVITPENQVLLKGLLVLPDEIIKARGNKQLSLCEIAQLLKVITLKNQHWLKDLLALPKEIQEARETKELNGSEVACILEVLTCENEPWLNDLLALPKEIRETREIKELDGYEVACILKVLASENKPWLNDLLALPKEIREARKAKELDGYEAADILKVLTSENKPWLNGLLALPKEILETRKMKQLTPYEVKRFLTLGIDIGKLQKIIKLEDIIPSKIWGEKEKLNELFGPMPKDKLIEKMKSFQKLYFGELSKEKAERVKKFEKNTNVKLYLDGNLDEEYIELIEETLNKIEARGLKKPNHIFLTNFMPESEINGLTRKAQGYIESKQYSEPDILYINPMNKETTKSIFMDIIAHEIIHMNHKKLSKLDHLRADISNNRKLIMQRINLYAATCPSEFIASMGEMLFNEKIRKEIQPEGNITYKSDLIPADDLKKLVELYEKFEGPEFKPTHP